MISTDKNFILMTSSEKKFILDNIRKKYKVGCYKENQTYYFYLNKNKNKIIYSFGDYIMYGCNDSASDLENKIYHILSESYISHLRLLKIKNIIE